MHTLKPDDKTLGDVVDIEITACTGVLKHNQPVPKTR